MHLPGQWRKRRETRRTRVLLGTEQKLVPLTERNLHRLFASELGSALHHDYLLRGPLGAHSRCRCPNRLLTRLCSRLESSTSSLAMSPVWDSVVYQANLLSTVAWDTGLAVYNLVAPDLPKGSVIAPGKPGHAGKWPEFHPPRDGDSRSPCPAMNAMSNHGILPRDGKKCVFQVLRVHSRD
jgi:hypothetical protein